MSVNDAFHKDAVFQFIYQNIAKLVFLWISADDDSFIAPSLLHATKSQW